MNRVTRSTHAWYENPPSAASACFQIASNDAHKVFTSSTRPDLRTPETVYHTRKLEDTEENAGREQAISAAVNAWHQYQRAEQLALLTECYRWLAIIAHRETAQASKRANRAELEVCQLRERTRMACKRADAVELEVQQLREKVRAVEISIEHQRQNIALVEQAAVDERKQVDTWIWVAAQNTWRADITINTTQQGPSAASPTESLFGQHLDTVVEAIQYEEEALHDKDEVPSMRSECLKQASSSDGRDLQMELRLL